MKKVVVAGSLVLDIEPIPVPGGDFSFLPGRKTGVSSIVFNLGGVVGNTGVALARLGMPTFLLGKVGEDVGGRIVSDLLGRLNVPNRLEKVSTLPTSTSIVLPGPNGERMILQSKGAGQSFIPEDIAPQLLSGVSLLHFGNPPSMRTLWSERGKGLVKLLGKVRDCDVATSLGICMPDIEGEAGKQNWKAILARSLPLVDLFLPDIEDLLFMLERPLFDRLRQEASAIDALDLPLIPILADELIAMGTGVVCIKIGKYGLYLRTAGKERISRICSLFDTPSMVSAWSDQSLWIPPCHVPHIVSTKGARDTATAGFLAAVLSGHGPMEALVLASQTAARCLMGVDATSNIPSLSELEKEQSVRFEHFAIASGWRKQGFVYFRETEEGKA